MGLCSKIGLIIVAIIFPPLAVLIRRGCGLQLLLNVVLTILGWIPGMIHALYIILAPKHHHHHHC